MNKKLFGIGCLFIISTVVLIGCTSQQASVWENSIHTTLPQAHEDNGKALQIVTTFPPLYAHTANIIDGNDTLTNLVPPGTSIHTWQPKPSDVVAMEEADAIIINGLWLEEFLEDYLDSLEKKWVVIINTSEWVPYMEFDKDDHGEDDEHHHTWHDPHIWLDPNNAELQVNTIVKALITLDPHQEIFYTTQAIAYTKKLQSLDDEISTLIASEKIDPFIVFHDAYQYFLHAYNLEDKQVGWVQQFHGDNPSQKEIAWLIQTIINNGVAIIYTEPQFNPSVVQILYKETGVKTKELDPIGSELSKDGYIHTIKTAAEAFANK